MWNKLIHLNTVIDPISVLLGITAATIGHWIGYAAAVVSFIWNGIRVAEWAINKWTKNNKDGR